jgi:hypothetical protein
MSTEPSEVRRFPELQEMFQIETLSTLVSDCCMNLLTVVQVAYEHIHERPSSHPNTEIPEFLRVEHWHRGEISGRVNSTPILNELGQPISLQMSIEVRKNEVSGSRTFVQKF